jgi:hypothetical protein
MKVLKMTVPICHFAQFARPLHYRITALHHQAWKKELLRPPPSPLSPAVQTLSLVSKHVNICNLCLHFFQLHLFIFKTSVPGPVHIFIYIYPYMLMNFNI